MTSGRIASTTIQTTLYGTFGVVFARTTGLPQSATDTPGTASTSLCTPPSATLPGGALVMPTTVLAASALDTGDASFFFGGGLFSSGAAGALVVAKRSSTSCPANCERSTLWSFH